MSYFTGSETVCVVSGNKADFVVSPAINPGTCENITIMKNTKGRFKFGAFSWTDLGQDNEHVHVNMFDAQQAANAVKIIICRSKSTRKFHRFKVHI